MSNNNNLHHHNKLINHHHHHHHHHILPPTTTTTRSNSSTTQACAACRYQRRKCAPDCILAPYFPHDRQRQFQNVHKLFGVSNITKIIRDLDTPQKDEAMRTIIYQADVRAHDPVGGCYRIIRELQRQIEYSRAELDIVLHQLAFCRTNAQNQNHQLLFDCDVHLDDNNNNNPDDVDLYDHGLDLDLGQMPQQQDDQYMLEEHHLNDQEDGHVAPIQEMNSWANMNNSPPSSAVCLEVKAPDECDEFKPLMIPAHEFKFDDINEPSEETPYNDGNQKALTKEDNVTFFTKDENVSSYQQHNEDNDLKGAATLFTLTNCSSY